MATLSKSVAKGLASLSLIIYFCSLAVFLILSLVDYAAPKLTVTGGVTQTSLVFGTGTYWVVNLSVPFFFFLLFFLSTIIEYYALKEHATRRLDPAERPSEKINHEKAIAIYNWPLYKQDVWTFMVMNTALWAILIGCYVGFQVFYGYNVPITENPTGSDNYEMTDRFQSNTLIAITIDFTLLWLAFDCIYAYIYEIYDSIERSETLLQKIKKEYGRDSLRKPGQTNVFK